MAGTPGANLKLAATTGTGRQTTRSLGMVPYTIASDQFSLTPAISHDPLATVRRLAVDGTHIYASSGYPWDDPGLSDEIFAFDTTQPLAGQVPAVFHAGEAVQNLVVSNGWAYVAGATDFITVDLSTGTAYRATGHSTNTAAVAVSGSHAFVSAGDGNSPWKMPKLLVYDISNPASPQLLHELNPFDSNADTLGLKLLGPNRLVAFEPDGGNRGKVAILDITNVANISTVGSVDVSDATDGYAYGNTLFVTGDYDGVSIVDITNSASPRLLGWVGTVGSSLGVAQVSPNVIAIATGTAGLAFVDVSDRTNPVIKGVETLGGGPQDVVVVGKTIYAAGESALDAL